jgi:GDP-mannose 6-dehydrogenase
MARVSVFGIGYVGCVTGACLARDGHHVIGVDVDAAKVAELNSGQSPIEEPGLRELVAEQVRAGRLSATRDVERAVRESDIALICVGTPSTPDGRLSSNAVEKVVENLGGLLKGRSTPFTIVIRSTLLPGLLEGPLTSLLEQSSGLPVGEKVFLCNNPEFLRESCAIRDYDNPPFVLVGAGDESSADVVLDLYRHIQAEKIATGTRTAALVKYACNAFHAVKIAFANEIGVLAQSFGADGHEVMSLVCKDRKLNISAAYLRPGFAFGGSCLPKDLRAMTRYGDAFGLCLELLRSILPANEAQIQRGLRLIQQTGCRKIGLVGLSFKAGTDDLRESPLVILAETLLGRGFDVRIYDPHVQVSRLRGRNLAYVDRHLPHLAALFVETPQELLDHAGLLVLGTDVAKELDLSLFEGHTIDLRRDLAMPAAPQEDARPAGLRELCASHVEGEIAP